MSAPCPEHSTRNPRATKHEPPVPLRKGNLPFANLPLTHDYSKLEERNGRLFHRDLRPDYTDADYPSIADAIVRQINERAPAVQMITIVTHNDHDYTDLDDPVRRNYDIVLEQIQAACERHGMKPVGTTVDVLCDMVLALPNDEAAFVPA